MPAHSVQGQYLFGKYLLKSTRSVAHLKARGYTRKTSYYFQEMNCGAAGSQTEATLPDATRCREMLVSLQETPVEVGLRASGQGSDGEHRRGWFRKVHEIVASWPEAMTVAGEGGC